MARSPAVQKLLDRKEAVLTALMDADADIEHAEKALVERIEAQRAAYEAALAAGWSSTDLAELGVSRHRRYYHLVKKLAEPSPATRNGTNNHDLSTSELSRID
ncbi:hypothetical protein [Mycolicibacterium fortuitum]|uniref:hypothetical protein n=1 Tax=Mycolicibacterium fortuitum TaxID=1766 RepID=UPI001CE2247F|nr:hypothetical protein [Mycolicibacterium fortuitum]MCA4726677.1 hypothetical protein [Mycolicibacterium fortuitum]